MLYEFLTSQYLTGVTFVKLRSSGALQSDEKSDEVADILFKSPFFLHAVLDRKASQIGFNHYMFFSTMYQLFSIYVV